MTKKQQLEEMERGAGHLTIAEMRAKQKFLRELRIKKQNRGKRK